MADAGEPHDLVDEAELNHPAPVPDGYTVWYTTAPGRWDVPGATTLACTEVFDGRPLRRVALPAGAASCQRLVWQSQGPFAALAEADVAALRRARRVVPMPARRAHGAPGMVAALAREADDAAAAAERLLVRVRLACLGLSEDAIHRSSRLWPNFPRLTPAARRWLLDGQAGDLPRSSPAD
jgi:hypothetical protein